MEIKFIVGSQTVILTGYGILSPGRTGDMAPETILETMRIGSMLIASSYRQERRPLDIPMLFQADTREALITNVRAILAVLSSGEGILRTSRVVSSALVQRELHRCYYRDGLKDMNMPGRSLKTVLSFEALDPYWYDPTAVVTTFTPSAVPSFFPFFPLALSASTIIERKTVTNPGVEAWPVWTVTGPGVNPTIYNYTTGKQISLVCTLAAGDVLTIDTSPLEKTVVINGVNAYGYMTAASELFSLQAGANDLSIQMNYITAGVSGGTMTYYPRYISL